jgi:hypothetical protein
MFLHLNIGRVPILFQSDIRTRWVMTGIYKFNTKEVKILYLVLIILINSAGWFRNALAWTQPITPVISQHPVDICLSPKNYEVLSHRIIIYIWKDALKKSCSPSWDLSNMEWHRVIWKGEQNFLWILYGKIIVVSHYLPHPFNIEDRNKVIQKDGS